MKRELKSKLGQVLMLEPQSINDTDTNSNLLDRNGCDSVVVSVLCGTFTGVDADSKLLAVLQESDTTADTDFAAVAAGNIEGAFTTIDATNEDSVIQSVGYKGSKRYVRVKLDFTTGTGGITAAPVAIIGLLSNPNRYPFTAPSPVAAT